MPNTAYRKRYRERNKDKEELWQRRTHLKSKYNLTEEQYNEMLRLQNGVCAICRQPESAMRRGKIRNLCVDHCHTTGQVRGLLCVACNLSIGYLKDSALLLRVAADYIEKRG